MFYRGRTHISLIDDTRKLRKEDWIATLLLYGLLGLVSIANADSQTPSTLVIDSRLDSFNIEGAHYLEADKTTTFDQILNEEQMYEWQKYEGDK